MTRLRTFAGIFVGGASTRMGGVPKGLLLAPGSGETLVVRWIELFHALDIEALLVGRRAEYAAIELPVLDDDPPGIGPLGGLVALLRHAGEFAGGRAVAVACDMPFVTPGVVTRLVDAPDATAVAPRVAGVWSPMLARYDAAAALPVAERRARGPHHSMQGLLDELRATELPLFPGEEACLADWDSPQDV